MKLILILLLLTNAVITREATKDEVKTKLFVRTSFHLAFERIHSMEGYYVNNPLDKGGETYRGISRKHNKNWLCWIRVDEHKKKTKVTTNSKIPSADWLVTDYYLNLWVKEGFDQILDADLAAYLFEFRIGGNNSIKIMRRLLKEKGHPVAITPYITPEFIDAVNMVNPIKFKAELKQRRLTYYENIVKRDSTQIIFLKSWKRRIN